MPILLSIPFQLVAKIRDRGKLPPAWTRHCHPARDCPVDCMMVSKGGMIGRRGNQGPVTGSSLRVSGSTNHKPTHALTGMDVNVVLAADGHIAGSRGTVPNKT